MTNRHATHYCPTCESTSFDPDLEFVDEEGYVCPGCSSNVYYAELGR